jgi:predicted RNase H-like nuclease (RuvC/YqgF family)
MVWFLLLIGILLVVFNVRAIRREKNSFNSIYHDEIEDMREFEVRLGEMRREFSETILELQKDIEELKDRLRDLAKEAIVIPVEESRAKINNTKTKDLEEKPSKVSRKNYENRTEELSSAEPKKAQEDKIKEESYTGTSNSVKIEEINKLLSKGFSVEEVSKKLGIGKGEVLLIKDLYLK